MTARLAVKTRIITLLFILSGVSAKAQLAANFSGNPLSGCVPLVVNFTDLSTGNPTQWKWDLGNGTISFLRNPSVTYFNPGQYTVQLIVFNASGNSDTLTRTNYITVNALPVIGFTGSPLTGCYPLPVQFTDQSNPGSSGTPQWLWDFGDGNSSTVQHPAHTYNASGNYNVSLRVTNAAGCASVLTKPAYVHINTGVHAGFTNSTPNTCTPPTTISFTNTSTGSGTLSYQWTFGDGGTSTLINPSHTYTNAGTYTVRLIVINNNGCRDTLTRANSIIIGTVNAEFTNAPSVCVNNSISFTNTSSPTPVSSAWDFGDGTTSTAASPVKQYSNPGNYVVRLIANFGSCTDTAYHSVNVLPKPTSAFNAIDTAACRPPLTVNFMNGSLLPGYSYQWDFGDGNTSTQASPTHTYTSSGLFTVTLITTNFTGCSDTLKRISYIKIQPPQVTIDNLPQSYCAPLTWQFTSTVNSVVPITGYEWDFGDGNTSTQASPTHTFPAGSYTIRLVITTQGGCTDTATVVDGIIASTRPSANFTATPRDACAHTQVGFTDLSTGNITQWLWNFGDGATSTEQNPNHMYEDTGYFTVRLVVWNHGCKDTIIFTDYIHINPPIANFTNTFSCTDPRIQTFHDQSIGADEWNWTFGDGNTSTVQNPLHTYADTGTYAVSLLVKNYTTGCQYTRDAVVRVMIEKADFTVSDSVICKKTPVTFSAINSIAAHIASYEWDFGDGSTGTGQHPVHTYTQAGHYNVRLIVKDVINCSDTLTKPLYIEVDGPTAKFQYTGGICAGYNVSYADLSVSDGVHPIQTWIIDYYDGTIDTLHTPVFNHTYTYSGAFFPNLKVIDSKGCVDSFFLAAGVLISDPKAGFSTLDTLSCPTKTISFTDASVAYTAMTYEWDFGDGQTSITQNPTHSYTADGLYTINLIITDTYGCKDTMNRPNYVLIGSPHADFAMSDSVTTCPPLFVNFSNTSLNYDSEAWDFGDGTSTQTPNPSHFYTTAGIYHPKLYITSPGGCTDSIVKTIIIRGPQGNFSYGPVTGCKPLSINFTASTQDRLSFVWDFNDGNVVNSTDSALTYTYTLLGDYLPKMILVDTNGCQVPVAGTDTIHVRGVDARFTFSSPTLCNSGAVAFTDASAGNDPITSYAWDFGDGNTSATQSPTHLYNTTGLFTPQLIVTTQAGCKDTMTAAVPVKIVAIPQASIGQTPNGCAPLTVNFNGSLTVPDTSALSWNWNLGNGNTSSLQNPPAQLYTTAGTYNIQLIVVNSSGCRDTVNKTVDAYLVPTIDAGLDTMVCRGSGTTLHATGAATYTWSPPTGLSCNNCANPVASPDSLTRYSVTGTTAQGCSNTDSVTVRVKQRFVMDNSKGDTLCKGGSVRLYARGANTYAWSPAASLSNPVSATPLASPPATTTYRVIGTDDVGCFRDTAFITVKVYPIPTVEAGEDKTVNAGHSITLMPKVSADVNNVLWTPTLGIVSSTFPGVVVKPMATTQYTVEARNEGGCKSRDIVTVHVICDGANVFIPNTFSPNGDGVNDVFYPRGTGVFSIRSFRVFNRWGQVVFEKNDCMPNDPNAGWDGRYYGQRLNADVFVYTVEVVCDNSSILTFKGNIALIQ
ncbi:MAG: PKD domain-containing protein [Ferruginibacter sp.]